VTGVGHEVFVHLGSALAAPPNWINVDASWNALLSKLPTALGQPVRRLLAAVAGETLLLNWPRNILVRDVRRGLPFDSDSVSAVYASHLIEHVEREEASSLVSECHRVLRPGGVLRLVTPDLQQLARNYLAAKPNAATAADDFVASWNVFHSRSTQPVLRWYRSFKPLHSHKWLYDGESLRALLERVGFRWVERRGFLDSRIPAERLREVELEGRFVDSVCVEGCK
jgi:predicted SAM-dependent methyltransferase